MNESNCVLVFLEFPWSISFCVVGFEFFRFVVLFDAISIISDLFGGISVSLDFSFGLRNNKRPLESIHFFSSSAKNITKKKKELSIWVHLNNSSN